MQEHKKHNPLRDVLRVLFGGIAIFSLISIISYHPNDVSWLTTILNTPIKNFAGKIGANYVFLLTFFVGKAIWVFPFLLFYWSISIPKFENFLDFIKECFGAVVLVLSFAGLFALGKDSNIAFYSGGVIGFQISDFFTAYFNYVGSFLIFSTLILLSLTLATQFYVLVVLYKMFNFIFVPMFSVLLKIFKTSPNKIKSKQVSKNEKIETQEHFEKRIKEDINKIHAEAEKELKHSKVVSDMKAKPEQEKPRSTIKLVTPETSKEDVKYSMFSSTQSSSVLPHVNLLEKRSTKKKDHEDAKHITYLTKILEQTLINFDIDAKVVQANRGPIITVFEVQPAPGVKINKITALSNDIALALKAKTVRIVAPIPGKAAVGIEVPNPVSETVSFRDLVESEEFQRSESKLTLALGKDVEGAPIITALDKMPHLLIAGATGSGKTVCVNSLILSILYKSTADNVKFLMIDPKMVEMTFYNDIPHMITPVVTDPKKAACALNWAVKEMEKRYELFATVGVRNISGYNKRMNNMSKGVFVSDGEEKKELPKKLPYIVIVVDELADLMMTAAQEVEAVIIRLAQLSRAAGLHLILATQRPSVNVITGLIKANMPCRIGFKVSSSIDSRTILDSKGSEALLGKGDMLFLAPGTANLIRGQGCFLTDEEIKRVIDYLKNTGTPEYEDEAIFSSGSVLAGSSGGDEDELYDEAVSIIMQAEQASASFLQRRMRIGYNRAARLIEAMEEKGVVSPARGSKPREVLVKSSEYVE